VTLTEFLTARYDEREAAAKAAARVEPEDAETSRWYGHAHWVARYGTVVDAADNDYAMMTESTDEVCAHIALNDPARVLREVEAGRKILAEHTFLPDSHPLARSCPRCITDREGYQEEWLDDDYPCLTLRVLAAVWCDHPDYDPAWAPQT